ncbi:MAG: MFS transporter [Proteobacteria bacterium]|nr:MFS transporter [Pseudomonadota bacterium]
MARFYRDNARWLMAGLLLAFCSSFGQTFFISLFAGQIKAVYGLSDGGWGGIYTAATLISAALLIQAGGLADTVALGRLTLMVLGLYAVVAAGMAFNTSVLVLVALIAGLRFCGQGMTGHIAMTAMGRWFQAHRGRAVAVAGLGYSLGEAVLPSVVVALVVWIGWRATWGGVALVLAIGFAPLLMWLLSESRQPRGVAAAEAGAGLGGRHWRRREVLSHWLFWALMPGILAPNFIGTAVFFHQVHVSEVKGWELAQVVLGYPAYAALTVASSLACGWLVDRAGAVGLLPFYLLPMALGITLIAPGGILGESVGSWYLMMALIGLTQGGSVTLLGALWPELYGTRNLGAIKALATSAMVFATALGPGVTGLLIDAGIAFPDQTWGFALWCLLGSGVFVAVRSRLRAEMG